MNDCEKLIDLAQIAAELGDPRTARLIINCHEILASRPVPGLEIDAQAKEKSVELAVVIKQGVVIEKPVYLCFGVLQSSAEQMINLNVRAEKGSAVSIVAYCIFPHAVEVKHVMNGEITLEEGSRYHYFERHIHSESGGLEVYPRAVVSVAPQARFKTDFELLRGRVGRLEIDYQVTGEKESRIEVETRVSGLADDVIKIREGAVLQGERARGVLKSRVAVRDSAQAEIYNSLVAAAAGARGHIDCTEILQGQGTVKAYPVAEVLHPKARVTHEARLGGVENKQLETLMARGLSETEAEELIIKALLS